MVLNFSILGEQKEVKDIGRIPLKKFKSIGAGNEVAFRKSSLDPSKFRVKNFPHANTREESKFLVGRIPTIQVTKNRMGSEAKSYSGETERKVRIQEQLDKIDDVHRRIGEEGVKDYDKNFCDRAEDDIVTLAEIELEDLNEESKKALQLKEWVKEEEKKKYEKQYKDLILLKAEAKNELYHQGEIMKRQVNRLEQESIALTDEKTAKMKGGFMRVRKILKGYLSEEKNEVESRYKELSVVDREDVHKLRRESRNRPQIIRLRLQVARCLKDKLPKGRYAILCTILDSICGSPLVFENKDAYMWRKVSAPKIHSGEYSLANLRFEKTIHLVAPSQREISPSMVYLFELFLLRSKEYTHDQVLGWGLFPLSNSEFELNLGRFKVNSLILQ